MSLFRSDRHLLEAFRKGNRRALARVYHHYVDVVTEVARRGVIFSSGAKVQGLPAHEVMDLVQETFMRAFSHEARQRYDGVRDYKPYLLTICRNLVADWARQNGREVPTEHDSMGHQRTASAPDELPEPWAHPA